MDSSGPSTVGALLAAYRRRDLSPIEVVNAHLDSLNRVNPELNAFVSVFDEEARAAAAASESRWDRGEILGPLDGVPVTVKDIVDMAGHPTSEGSAVGGDEPAPADSPPVARLREAGVIFLGKTTTSEFGWKGMTDTPRFGVTRNPWNRDHTPGGSSGGAGASLAAGVGVVAHGSDGGGSIRIPASYCGLIGHKPSFGRVPQAPVGSPFSTLVSNGVLARSVEDSALLLNVLSRPDRRDWYALPHDRRDWTVGLSDGFHGLTVAYSDSLGGASTDPDVARVCRAVVEEMQSSGVAVAEAGSVFDPLRPRLENYWKAGFGARLAAIPSDRWSELDPGFAELAREGLGLSAADVQAGHAARIELAETMERFHEDIDVLLTPTMPSVAPPTTTVYHSAEFDRWADAVPFTVPFNYTGQPAMSIPVGFVDRAGGSLPVGLQVVARRHDDATVLRTGRAILDLIGWSWAQAGF